MKEIPYKFPTILSLLGDRRQSTTELDEVGRVWKGAVKLAYMFCMQSSSVPGMLVQHLRQLTNAIKGTKEKQK